MEKEINECQAITEGIGKLENRIAKIEDDISSIKLKVELTNTLLKNIIDARDSLNSNERRSLPESHIVLIKSSELKEDIIKSLILNDNYYVLSEFNSYANNFGQKRYAFYKMTVEGGLLPTNHNAGGYGFKSFDTAIEYANRSFKNIKYVVLAMSAEEYYVNHS